MLVAPTWYRWRWSMSLPGMGQSGKPSTDAASVEAICHPGPWIYAVGEQSWKLSPDTGSGPVTWPPGGHTTPIQSLALSSSWGGNDRISLTQERLMNPNTPKRYCYSLIYNHCILHQRAIEIACNVLKLTGLLLQFVPRVLSCTPMHRATHPVCYDFPIGIINDRIRDSISSNQLIPLNLHLHAWPGQSIPPPPTGKLENRAVMCCLAVPPLNGIQKGLPGQENVFASSKG